MPSPDDRATGDGPAAARAFLAGAADWPHPVYLCLRRRGRRLWHDWLVQDQRAGLEATIGRHPGADRAELFLPAGFRPADDGNLPARWTGIHGIEVRAGDRVARMAPSHMIAANHTFARALARCRAVLDGAAGEVRRIVGHTVVLPLAGDRQPVAWHRAGPPAAALAPAALAHALGGWLVANTGADGRLTYKYWPSRGRESAADNTVRQFMGTLALGRYARWSGGADAADAWQRNLDRQIDTYYAALPDGAGMIAHGGTAKLGAAAIAALALLEAPATPRRMRALGGLIAGIERLWRADGSFRTFHVPAGRNDNQNFYPGEACLFWAHLHARRRDGAVLARLLASLDHYRDWHRRQRNPAFVPWHAQAHAALYAATGMTGSIGFVFEMTDWLLPLQQWDTAPADDMRGRFYDPARPHFGPPHAASTGAYMEGLAAAATLARAVGESQRAARYARAFARAMRNIQQLAFLDDEDFFYISRRGRVHGGVRTEVYDNTIRIDNVQHPLMAILSILPSVEGSGSAATGTWEFEDEARRSTTE